MVRWSTKGRRFFLYLRRATTGKALKVVQDLYKENGNEKEISTGMTQIAVRELSSAEADDSFVDMEDKERNKKEKRRSVL